MAQVSILTESRQRRGVGTYWLSRQFPKLDGRGLIPRSKPGFIDQTACTRLPAPGTALLSWLDVRNTLAGLGALRWEQVEASTGFRCGAVGSIPVSGPVADRENPCQTPTQ